jgi:hypothetical protein
MADDERIIEQHYECGTIFRNGEEWLDVPACLIIKELRADNERLRKSLADAILKLNDVGIAANIKGAKTERARIVTWLRQPANNLGHGWNEHHRRILNTIAKMIEKGKHERGEHNE